MKRRVEDMKDGMWKKNESFCLETEVQGSEFLVNVSKQWQNDHLVGVKGCDPALGALD